MENKIIAIDAVINTGAKVVKKMLAQRGTRNPINEKHAGHTPIKKPSLSSPAAFKENIPMQMRMKSTY